MFPPTLALPPTIFDSNTIPDDSVFLLHLSTLLSNPWEGGTNSEQECWDHLRAFPQKQEEQLIHRGEPLYNKEQSTPNSSPQVFRGQLR